MPTLTVLSARVASISGERASVHASGNPAARFPLWS
jgi:hypothetical protein